MKRPFFSDSMQQTFFSKSLPSFPILMRFFIACIVFGISSCYPYSNRESVFRSEGIALFKIDPKDLPGFYKITKTNSLDHPIQLDQNKVKDYLGNLRYSKRTTIGYFSDFVFSDHELDVLARDLPFALKALPKDKLLLLITKYDDTQSVISYDELTTCILWATDARLNVVFGRIKREIVDKDQTLLFDRWTRIEEIPLEQSTDGTEIVEGENFDFGLAGGVPQRKWVSFDLKNPTKYKFLPRKQYGPVKLTDENDRP
ncbi:LA_1326/LA_4305 family lipoprotein [Leptospira fainei]|uniref:LA_1326/LA_4305 family lipoprotein n=1 Tax=Leptospira fainei TaxID=48782 RepID=UPI00068589A7